MFVELGTRVESDGTGPRDAADIGLEAINLLQIRASATTMAKIEQAVLKFTSGNHHARIFLKQYMNMSLLSHVSSGWHDSEVWRLYANMFLKTTNIEPSVGKRKCEIGQQLELRRS